MNDLMNAVFNLMFAMAKAEADTEDEETLPVLFEDEIAEILNEHKGEEILIYYHPEGPLHYRYYCYDLDKSVVFTIYDALNNHHLVTVNGANITDL